MTEKPGLPGAIPSNEPEEGHEIENAAEAQKYARRESLSDELINGAETPEELYRGLRLLESQLEDSRIPPNLSERYTPPRQLSVMYERANMMGYSIDELKEKNWLTNYDLKTEEGKPKDERYAALAVSSERREKTDESGRFLGYEIKYKFGNNESREKLKRAYERAWVELAARDILGEHCGLRMAVDVRDSLSSLVAILHSGRMPKFKPDHLEALFNMPSVAELANNPENRQLGDMVEEALFLNLVMLRSGGKQEMLNFLERPGAKHLIAKIAKEWGVTYDQWMHENIGDVGGWEDDDKRLLTDDGDRPATWRLEAADGRRGILTKWSNIAAWGGKPGEFSNEKEVDFIEKTIGGLVGGGKEGIEAAWVACVIMRAIGAYASEGYVALPNGKSHLPLGEGRFISGDDTGKLHVYMFNMKEGLKGRNSGLRGMIGKFPDMAMNLFDWAGVVVGKDNKGRDIKRSIWDAWLGTAGGKPITDIVTGKATGKTTTEESYHRLGDLNFKSLEREFHSQFTIIQWLTGNAEQPTGVFTDAIDEEFKPESFKIAKNKKRWKYLTITMNPIVMTQGSTHLYDLGKVTEDKIETVDLVGGTKTSQIHVVNTEGTETIQKRFLKNLMAARIRSSEFSTELITQTKRILNTTKVGPPVVEVPFVRLVTLWCKEVFKPNPRDEDELIAHYIDDLIRIDLTRAWDDAINSYNEVLGWFSDEVGRVIGRKKVQAT